MTSLETSVQSVDQQVQILELVQLLKTKNSLSDEEKELVGTYTFLNDAELSKSLKFYKQLQLGWIYLENLQIDYEELAESYNICEWVPIYEDSDKGSQSYAEIKTPKFIKKQIPLAFYHLSSFLKIHPNATVGKHSHEVGRNTVLLIPFKGEQKTIPLEFWKDQNNLLSTVIVDKPTIINTNILHAIHRTSEQERTNYNLNFNFPFTFASVSDILVNRMGL